MREWECVGVSPWLAALLCTAWTVPKLGFKRAQTCGGDRKGTRELPTRTKGRDWRGAARTLNYLLFAHVRLEVDLVACIAGATWEPPQAVLKLRHVEPPQGVLKLRHVDPPQGVLKLRSAPVGVKDHRSQQAWRRWHAEYAQTMDAGWYSLVILQGQDGIPL